jgi:cell division transport system permease protein
MTSVFVHKSKDAHYDLPLHQKLGTEFLILLMTLMTVLCLLATSTSVVLGKALSQWTSGLENSLTIEVPAGSNAAALATSIENALDGLDGVKRATRLNRDDISGLIAPWLDGLESQLSDLPLPILIQVDLRLRDHATIESIRSTVAGLSDTIRIDAYETWLTDLMRLTTTIRLVAFALLIMILSITALTIAGAVRSRMAIHHEELRLLHIMGAEDRYIAKQFRNYILQLAMRGVIFGCALFILIFGLFFLIKPETGLFIPSDLSALNSYVIIGIVPFVLIILSFMTAQHTVLKVLRAMP